MTALRRPDEMGEGLRGRLVAMIVALLTVAVLALSAIATVAFNQAVEPELSRRTRLIGAIVRAELQRALDVGVQLEAMAGLDAYLSETLGRFGEVDRIAVVMASGNTISEAVRPGDPTRIDSSRFARLFEPAQVAHAFPIVDGNRLFGEIRVETSRAFMQARLADVFLDIAVIAMVAVLMALELAVAIAALSVGKPLERIRLLLDHQAEGNFLHRIRRGGLGSLGRVVGRLNDHAEDLAARLATLPAQARDRALAGSAFQVASGRPKKLGVPGVSDIRPALFMFSVATEVSVSFLPVFARMAEHPAWLPPDLAAAAPLMVYLIALALLAPFGGALARRYGPRTMFLVSAPPTALALAGLAYSDSIVEIVFWRGLMAIFYALATIACQEYALRADAGRGTARSIGAFVAVIYAGVFCGSALGGVVAGRFGFTTAFLGGALLALLAGSLGVATMRGTAGDAPVATGSVATPASGGGRLGMRFIALLVGAAIPMSTATAVFIWYLTPLMLAESGSGPAEIARVVMLYYLPVVVLGSAVTNLTDGRVGPLPLLIAGSIGSAASLLWLGASNQFWQVVVAVGAFGTSHTLMRTPAYALADRLSADPARGRAALRLFERVGAIAGLLTSAWFLPVAGAEASIRTMGAVVLAGTGLVIVAGIARRGPSLSRSD